MLDSPTPSAAEPRPSRRVPSAGLPWHRRLEARVLAGALAVAGVSLAAILTVTSHVVSDSSLSRSTEAIDVAHGAFTQLVAARIQSGAKAAQLIAELPVFRDTVTEVHDEATISAMTADYCGKLIADFCVVSDPRGAWIGSAHVPPDATRSAALARAIANARDGQSAAAFITVDQGLYLVVAEPARFSEEVLATFTAAVRIDDRFARELGLVTHCDVSFICAGGELCGSSLPPPARQALAAAGAGGDLGPITGAPALRTLGSTRYVTGVYPLVGDEDANTRLALLQDWTPTERALAENRAEIVWAGVIVFGAAIAGALVLSRRLSRPLRDLAGAAHEIAAGDWSRRVPVAGPAEAQTTARAFNDMTTTLGHWREQAERRTRELNVSYERFRSVTDSVTDAIVSIDRHGSIVFWSLRAETMFGYTEREALNQSLAMIVPDRLQGEYGHALAQLAAGDRATGGVVELVAKRRDGHERPVELSLSAWKAGAELFFTGVLRDITDRKQAADALRQREEQLRQAHKMEAIGRLAGGVAHDFNNLLTAIVGCSELLLERLPADGIERRDVLEIQKAGRSAASLTRDLLAFSRKQVLQALVLDMNDVVVGAENLLRRLLGADIDLSIDLAPSLPAVTADPSQLEQVLLNLAVNARDAMPGGGQLRIATGLVPAHVTLPGATGPTAQACVTLSVTDSGVGMSEEVQARIFEPFFTTKEVGVGTGLGLAMVYGIVTQSGGHISVTSAPALGATFTVSLPASDRPLARQRAPLEPAVVYPQEAGTVLLVEDNEAVRRMAREGLLRAGFEVLEAANGEAALRLAPADLDRICLLLTDVIMPVMGGKELAARLRMRRPGLKVVFTSGYANDTTIGSASNVAAVFLQKPFSPSQLASLVRDVLASQPV
jgi:PAS domain S-box-containing protein